MKFNDCIQFSCEGIFKAKGRVLIDVFHISKTLNSQGDGTALSPQSIFFYKSVIQANGRLLDKLFNGFRRIKVGFMVSETAGELG